MAYITSTRCHACWGVWPFYGDDGRDVCNHVAHETSLQHMLRMLWFLGPLSPALITRTVGDHVGPEASEPPLVGRLRAMRLCLTLLAGTE